MICCLEVIVYLLENSEERQAIRIRPVVVLFGIWPLSKVDVDWPGNSQTVILVVNASNCAAACISQQNDWLCLFQILENWYISEHHSQVPNSAFSILSGLLFELLRCAENLGFLQQVGYWWFNSTYFLRTYQWKLCNVRSPWLSQTESAVGQSSILDASVVSILIVSVLIRSPEQPLSNTPSWHMLLFK